MHEHDTVYRDNVPDRVTIFPLLLLCVEEQLMTRDNTYALPDLLLHSYYLFKALLLNIPFLLFTSRIITCYYIVIIYFQAT